MDYKIEKTLRRILLYCNTIKYLKPVQVCGRIFSALKKILPANLPALPGSLHPSLKPRVNFIFHDPWNCYEDLSRNRFCFLNRSIDFNENINWKPDADLLWQFNLHYFNYLFLFPEEEKIKVCTDWINKNPLGKEPGWKPYPLSLRITNWCKASLKDNLINESLYKQAAFLFRNLEYYHPANHYLENARALIFAGLYFSSMGEAKKWLEKGTRIISDELPDQVLPDGGYFEKTIMYHALMLELVLDLLNILPGENEIYDLLKRTALRMLRFLNSLTHPDGKIALFNDSTEEIAPSTNRLEEYCKRLSLIENEIHSAAQPFIHSFPGSGYYTFADKDFYLVIDGGSIGPDFIPAHAHADIFSYEFSANKEKIITDSGVYEYNNSLLRHYSRSTRAHNTVTIDGINQAEVWNSFRTARRYPPENIKFEETDGKVFFSGVFTGFSRLIGDNLVHNREIIFYPEAKLLTIEDKIEGIGKHSAESYIHLHPSVEIKQEGSDLILLKKGIKIKLMFHASKFKIEEGLYFPEFGKKAVNKVVIIYSKKIPAFMKYSFQIISIG